MELQGY